MAITANVVTQGLAVSGAYARIQRIFGGKDEGKWFAAVQVYRDEAACWPNGRVLHLERDDVEEVTETPPATEENPDPQPVKVQKAIKVPYDQDATPTHDVIDAFTLAAPYQDADPRGLLYAALAEKLKADFGAVNVVRDQQ